MPEEAPEETPAAQDRLWPLYLGGFLGPFGGAVVTTMLPEMASDLRSSVASVSTALTAYLVPFAACMLVSGTVAERVGRRRTVQVAYLVYALASLACALAPSLGWLLTARGVQGAANAFTTPVLVAAISTVVAPGQLGRALGLFGSMQATGQAMAPLIGGVAASVHWSLAFYGSAVVALMLALVPPPNVTTPGTARPSWRSLLNRQLLLACVIAALAYLTSMGITVVGSLQAHEAFGLGPTARGVAVAVFGLAGLLTGRRLGSLLDRYGRLRFGAVSHLVMAAGAALIGLSGDLALFVAAFALAGAAGTATRTTAQSLAVTSAPDNRGGASSVMLACQFGGSALAPLLWVPLFSQLGGTTFWFIAVPAALAGLLLAVLAATAGRAQTGSL